MKTDTQHIRPQTDLSAEQYRPIRDSLRRAAVTVLAATCLTGAAVAATIQGTVLNQNTKRVLERATVQVQGTAFQTLTDKDGSFRLAGLPAGTYTVVASYAGLDEIKKGRIRILMRESEVPAFQNQTVRMNIANLQFITTKKPLLDKFVAAY